MLFRSNQVPLRFVRMTKNLNELIPSDKISEELASNASRGFFRKQVINQTDNLDLELRSKL